jgi:hypothetical protein
LFALIVLMSCAAVRAARTMTGRSGTEARATRADLSTEAQATRTWAQAIWGVAGGGWWVAGEEQTIRRPVGRAQRPRPLNRGPPPAWTALLLDFHLSRPQGVGPLSQVGAWEFLRSDVHSYPWDPG